MGKTVLKRKQPFEMPDLSQAEISAIKALQWGSASSEQQIKALDTILKKFCEIGGCPFWVEPHTSAFASGKQYIAVQIMNVLAMPIPRNNEQPS